MPSFQDICGMYILHKYFKIQSIRALHNTLKHDRGLMYHYALPLEYHARRLTVTELRESMYYVRVDRIWDPPCDLEL